MIFSESQNLVFPRFANRTRLGEFPPSFPSAAAPGTNRARSARAPTPPTPQSDPLPYSDSFASALTCSPRAQTPSLAGERNLETRNSTALLCVLRTCNDVPDARAHVCARTSSAEHSQDKNIHSLSLFLFLFLDFHTFDFVCLFDFQ